MSEFKCCAAVIPKFNGKVSQRDQQGKLVGSSEITFCEQALQLGQEDQLRLW